eukprot:228063-Pleurochrysis_carterae.AAC.1
MDRTRASFDELKFRGRAARTFVESPHQNRCAVSLGSSGARSSSRAHLAQVCPNERDDSSAHAGRARWSGKIHRHRDEL